MRIEQPKLTLAKADCGYVQQQFATYYNIEMHRLQSKQGFEKVKSQSIAAPNGNLSSKGGEAGRHK
jgi:hypothetical protein